MRWTPPPMATALRATWREGYGWRDLRQDAVAGATVGTVAIPLSMALAIATGVAPQHGLYTAIVAGAIIALLGGARFNISGPTAAFVVILLPIVQQYGLGGLLLATLMAGAILIAMGLARLGRLIEFVPYPVILGFTAGIAVVIAGLQVPDFAGLNLAALSRLGDGGGWADPSVWASLVGFRELAVGLVTLLVIVFWPRLRLPLPAPWAGLLLGSALAWFFNLGAEGAPVIDTIASRFQWEANGMQGSGIPPVAPEWVLPWNLPGADGQPLQVDFALIQALLGPAIAIAMLGAIESLLCAVVADGLTRTRHDPNAELIGQGVGNLLAPFFGGITATAALARTATNIRAGGRSPIAGIVHAGVVLLAVVALAPWLGYLPMASLAALLFVVAWNMSEARRFVHLLRSAPAADVAVLLVCFTLTVLFDMVLAVAVGIGLAAALFVRRMALLSQAVHRTPEDTAELQLPTNVVVLDIDGPLFFAVANKALGALRQVDPKVRTVILDMHGVVSLDATAMATLQSSLEPFEHNGVGIIISGLSPRLWLKLRRAGLQRVRGKLAYCRTLEKAAALARRWHAEASPT